MQQTGLDTQIHYPGVRRHPLCPLKAPELGWGRQAPHSDAVTPQRGLRVAGGVGCDGPLLKRREDGSHKVRSRELDVLLLVAFEQNGGDLGPLNQVLGQVRQKEEDISGVGPRLERDGSQLVGHCIFERARYSGLLNRGIAKHTQTRRTVDQIEALIGNGLPGMASQRHNKKEGSLKDLFNKPPAKKASQSRTQEVKGGEAAGPGPSEGDGEPLMRTFM
ncbi:hypothetical protein NDU88_004003 [Pleurodeles waltl]|uniref:Uncharacterized protein n=1 Tax=Pleurodeles waltl TaxID=8319 RepID=A0AAV7MSQ6_PLEWA|nr:hypothetical protein NDU88_004003 [Pleurodeles waltl]